jgi:hypothetical protein
MYEPHTSLVVIYFPTYLPIYETYILYNWLPRWNQYTNSVEIHPQPSKNRHPVDGALVGAADSQCGQCSFDLVYRPAPGINTNSKDPNSLWYELRRQYQAHMNVIPFSKTQVYIFLCHTSQKSIFSITRGVFVCKVISLNFEWIH